MASRAEYNKCMIPFLKDGKTQEQHKLDFCVGAKLCSSKAKSETEAREMCQVSLSQPKAPKTRKVKKARATRASGGMRVVLLTSNECKPCSAAKQYLKDKMEKGLIEELNIQRSDEAADLALKYGFQSVPKLLILDDEGVPFSELQITDQEQTI